MKRNKHNIACTVEITFIAGNISRRYVGISLKVPVQLEVQLLACIIFVFYEAVLPTGGGLCTTDGFSLPEENSNCSNSHYKDGKFSSRTCVGN